MLEQLLVMLFVSQCSNFDINVVHKPSSNGLLFCGNFFVAPEQVWIGPSAARVFVSASEKLLPERLSFSLFIERTSLEILGPLSSFIFLA